MNRIAILSIFIIAVACRDNDSDEGCIKKVLKENEMIAYLGQDVGCSTFLQLYEYEGEQYFMANNHCADMVFMPFDCEGRAICLDPESEDCQNFALAEYKGIVGIVRN